MRLNGYVQTGFLVSIFLCLFMAFAANNAAASILHVWANNGENKVTRDELRATQNATSVVNSVWNGQKISIFGARNEVVAFNLVLEAPLQNANNVSVTFNSLVGNGGYKITSVPVTGNNVFNWNGRDIELFYIDYLQIKGLSTDLFFDNYDERHIPIRFRRPWTGDGEGSGNWQNRPDHDKYYPEIAIPLELVPSFNITAGNNQSIWVDIYIPKNLPAGLYQGTVVIKESGTTTHQVPIELSVLGFTLPDIPSGKTMLVYSVENINDRYFAQSEIGPSDSDYQKSLLLANRHFQVAHRHKISLAGNPGGYTPVNQMNEVWKDRLNGNLFTPAKGYGGPGVGVGNNLYVIGEYGQWPWRDGTKSQMWSNTDAWVQWFDAANFATPTEYFLYLIDESDNFAEIEQWAQWINSNPGPGSRLMSMATIDVPKADSQTPSLDIPASWASIGITKDWQDASANYLNRNDKRFYLYNGNRPACGSFATEDDGISPRVMAWAQYKLKIDRWFYWESTYYDNYQGGEGNTNVFERAQTYGSYDTDSDILGQTGWNYLNGDGVLFYPGTDKRFPGDSYNVLGPFSSIRLKLWRRGLQDIDYLTMAAKVDRNRVDTIVKTMLPKAVWEYGVSDPTDPTWLMTDISWSIDPDTWEGARAELGRLITTSPFKPPEPIEFRSLSWILLLIK